MVPTRTPDTWTLWPCPGMTACALDSSAFSPNGSSDHGARTPWLERIHSATAAASATRPAMTPTVQLYWPAARLIACSS